MHTFSEHRKTSNTNHFLEDISRRLSGRQDTRGCEYHVNIVRSGDITIVDMSPLFYVYPDRYRRSQLDKKTILDWAMYWLFYEDPVTYKWNNSVQIEINDDCFIPGCYAYVKYENANRRKWIKVQNVDETTSIMRKEKLV